MTAGRKTGGRQKGVPNKATAAKAAAIAESGLTPLDYLLEVMRDVTRENAERMDAAKAAAPYVHPKHAASDGKTNNDSGTVPLAERLKAYAARDAIAKSGGKVVDLGKNRDAG